MVLENIEDYLPKYLSPESTAELVLHLKDFQNKPYYTSMHGDLLLQGDGWSKLQILEFETGKKSAVKGIILSNSCDIDAENQRDLPPKIVFAPLVSIRAYEGLLRRSSGLLQRDIEAKLASIRLQRVTSLFYLPAEGALDEECIALLGDVHSMPAAKFWSDTEKRKMFTLSQMGSYLFILKLSIHFCRFMEGVDRRHST